MGSPHILKICSMALILGLKEQFSSSKDIKDLSRDFVMINTGEYSPNNFDNLIIK